MINSTSLIGQNQVLTDKRIFHRIIKIMHHQAGVYLPRPVLSSPELNIQARSGSCSGRIIHLDKIILVEYRYAVRCPQNSRRQLAVWICQTNQARGLAWGCLNLDFSDGTVWHRNCLPSCAVGLDNEDLAEALCAGIQVFDTTSAELLKVILQIR